MMMMTAKTIGDFVSRETVEALQRYVQLILKWNRTINLIAKSTETDIWERHIIESIHLTTHIPPVNTLADLGSGAGLPGMVIALCRPEIAVALIEQDQRKAAFLRECLAQLDLKNVTILNEGILQVAEKYDCITARALAPLEALAELAHPLLGENGICLFPKGKNSAMELGSFEKHWQAEMQTLTSGPTSESCVFLIRQLRPVKETP